MFTPEPSVSLSSEQLHEMFIWLDDLPEAARSKCSGPYPLLQRHLAWAGVDALDAQKGKRGTRCRETPFRLCGRV
jgi:hypothetical protein